MSKVVAVRKSPEDQSICGYKLDDGRILDYAECLQAIANGEIEGLMAINNKAGGLSIKTYPDGDPSNNLQNLPTF